MSLITRKQAGLILNRPERTIIDWIENGVLKAHRVKSVLYVDSDTVYALKDTEADIDHALQERKAILKDLNEDLAEMRMVNHFNREEIRRAVIDMVNALSIPSMTEREKMVLSEVMEGKKYDDVGEVLGLSRERIRQLFEKALRKIRNCSVVYGKVYDEVLTLRGENQNLRKVIERQEAMLKDYREKLHMGEMPQEQMTAELYGKRLVDCDLSVRTLNCLKGADIETVGDLVQYNKTDLLRLRNFGKKSLTELDDFLASIGQEFGQKNITPVYQKRASMNSVKQVRVALEDIGDVINKFMDEVFEEFEFVSSERHICEVQRRGIGINFAFGEEIHRSDDEITYYLKDDKSVAMCIIRRTDFNNAEITMITTENRKF